MIRIFILHYQNELKTDRCVRAFADDARRWAEIVVIDNGSTERYTAKRDDVRVVRLPQNIPLIAAYNTGMQAHPSDIYICVANDTRPEPGMFGRLVANLVTDEIGVVAPGTNDRGVGLMYVPTPGNWSNIEMTHVDNTCWAFRHDVIQSVGWPDCEGHKHWACWASNQDFCYRVRQAGYQVVCVRSAYLWHENEGGRDLAAWAAGREWLVWKYGPEKARVISG